MNKNNSAHFVAGTRRLLFLAVLVMCWRPAQGQNIMGHIYDAKTRESLSNVTLEIEGQNIWAVSDTHGNFTLKTAADNYTLVVKSLGYQAQRIAVGKSQTSIEIGLEQESLELDVVVVTAAEQKLGSVSEINRTALQHTQPTSLYDALQLVPGQLAQNPDLSTAQQFTIRQVPTGSAAQRMNALGTALIMDGAPISNNSNLQVNQNILNASAGSLPPFSSVAGRGNDLRQIPADNIESIEVIRGIPSTRYGDLTSGAVLVSTLAGVYAPRMLMRLNPTLQQVSAGYGRKVFSNQTVNAEIDVTRAANDPRDDLNRFTRFNGQLTWELLRTDKIRFTNRLVISSLIDQAKEDPAAAMTRASQSSKDKSIRWSTNSKISTRTWFSDQINLVTSLSYGWQRSTFQELVTRDIFPVTDAMAEGTAPGYYGQSEYLNITTVEGRPMNLYGRAESAKRLKTPGLSLHNLIAGVEGRYENNRGGGRQFDPRTPPRQNYRMGDRPRSYSDIPALRQLAIYAEDKWVGVLAGRTVTTIAGVRWDMLYRETLQDNNVSRKTSTQHSLNPRVNTRYDLTSSLSVRVGYGGMTKMPTLSYLYPNPVYFDLVNFNYYAANPSERLVVLSTNIIRPDADQVKPYRSKKWEIGVDIAPKGSDWQIAFTAFGEDMDDAIQIIRWIKPLPNATYEAESFPVGQPPVLGAIPIAVDTFMAAYDKPVNNLRIQNKGIDFTIQSPTISSINTSFQLTGAIIHSRSEQKDMFLDSDKAVFNAQFSGNVPVYAAGQASESMRFNSSVRVITHVPAFKLVVSALIQTIWLEQDRLQHYDEAAVAYMDRTGIIKAVGETSMANPAELTRVIAPASLTWQERTPMWLFNFRVTKEWQTGRGFAFYTNNLFNSRPLYKDNVTGQNIARNQPEFFFGVELYYSFKN